MLAQKRLQHRHIPLPDLPQHPACRLVDQVLLVPEQPLADPERVGEVAMTDEPVGRQDADSPLPEARGLRQPVERLAAPVLQVAADDLGGREVHQVPIVDVPGVGAVEVVDPLPRRAVALLELDQNDQGEQPLLVDLGVEQALDLGQWKGLELLGDLPNAGTRTPMNTSPSPYSPGPVLKKRALAVATAGSATDRRRDWTSLAVIGAPCSRAGATRWA